MFGRLVIIITLLIVFAGLITYLALQHYNQPLNPTPENNQITNNTNQDSSDIAATTTIATNLDIPWSMVFLPSDTQNVENSDYKIVFTQRAGTVKMIDADGTIHTIATIPEVKHVGEGGLLGVTLHPNFENNNYLYLYLTYSSNGNNTLNRVVRYTFQNNTLSNPTIIVDKIPGASNHNGGRIKFGPDGYLYIGTGDAQEPSLAQNTNSLAGKILRVTDTGKAAPGNPFADAQGKPTQVYSYGHRNVQGLTWDNTGQLWATEHGRSGIQSGFDELNKIEAGKNYGWPDIEGDKTRSGMEKPYLHSGSTNTWAPSGAAYLNDAVFFAGLRGQALYEVPTTSTPTQAIEHFKSEYGRIRDVVIGPDRMIYIFTNNTDGRGNPTHDDDKLIKINPEKL